MGHNTPLFIGCLMLQSSSYVPLLPGPFLMLICPSPFHCVRDVGEKKNGRGNHRVPRRFCAWWRTQKKNNNSTDVKNVSDRGRDEDQVVIKTELLLLLLLVGTSPKLTASPSTPSLQVKSESARSPSFHSHMNNITRSAIIEIDDRY